MLNSHIIYRRFINRFRISLSSDRRLTKFVGPGAVVVAPTAFWLLRESLVSCDSGTSSADRNHLNNNASAILVSDVSGVNENSFRGAVLAWLSKYYNIIKKSLSVLKRILFCTSIVAPAFVLIPTCLYFRQEETLWNYIVWAVEQLGPTFIKLAQWGSSRPDIFPESLIARLERFQDSTTTYPWSVASKTLEESFGPEWEKDMHLEKEPIGSGCIAQVYKGTMSSSNGTIPVAVKLIHPHVKKIVVQDMQILQFFADTLETLFPQLEYLSLSDSVSQFSQNMRQQMDLCVEADHMKRFIRNFKDLPTVRFPRPIDGFITSNALVETFVQGVPITQYMKPGVDDSLKKQISELAVRIMLLMVFRDNFVHGDLHPGNILIDVKNGHPNIVLLDCGIVSQVAAERHSALVDTCLAFMYWDGKKAGELMLDHTPKRVYGSEDAFTSGIQKIVEKARTAVYFENIGSYIAEICRLSCLYRVKLIPDYLQIALAVKVVEGISLSLDPNLDLTSKAIPIVLQSQAQAALRKVIPRRARAESAA